MHGVMRLIVTLDGGSGLAGGYLHRGMEKLPKPHEHHVRSLC